MSEAQGEVSEAQGEVSEAQGEVSEAQGEMSEAQGEMSEAQGEMSEAQGETRSGIAALIPNLMDRSRFGGGVRFVRDASEAVGVGVVIVDLDRCDTPETFAVLACHTIGFGAHVDTARLESATAAGFDEVMARSAFFRRLPELLAVHGAGQGETG